MSHDTLTDNEKFIIAFHAKYPSCTPIGFAEGRTVDGKSSYSLLTDQVPEGSTRSVLDLACGDGYLLEMLATRQCANLKLTGIDMSPGELEVARKRLSTFQVALLEGKAQTLPFADASFDIVTCHMALMLMSEVETVLREIKRVLKPGGIFTAIVGGPADQWTHLDQFLELLDVELEAEGKEWLGRLGDKRIRSEEGIREIFAAGFEAPEITVHSLFFSAPLEAVVLFYMLMYDVALLSDARRLRLQENIARSLSAHLKSDGKIDFSVGLRQITVRSMIR